MHARPDAPARPVVDDAMRERFRTEGYFVLERDLPAEHLELLRRVAHDAVDVMDARMDAAGTDQLGIIRRGRRYFTNRILHRSSPGSTRTIRAFVLTAPEEYAVQDVAAPVAAPGEAVIDVERVGVCGTDVEFFTGQMAYLSQGHSSYPLRIGHEWCGRDAAADVTARWPNRWPSRPRRSMCSPTR